MRTARAKVKPLHGAAAHLVKRLRVEGLDVKKGWAAGLSSRDPCLNCKFVARCIMSIGQAFATDLRERT